MKLARLLIDKAKSAGADAVKFQSVNHITRLEKYNISYRDFFKLKVVCDTRGIEFMCTPHTFEAIHVLDPIVKRHKIASTYLGNANFHKEVASKNKPILLSTGNIMTDNGMASIETIKNAIKFISNADVTLLHCVSKYPCEFPHYEHIKLLEGLFDNPIGLSDHSKTITVPKVPVIEKHLMLDGVDCLDEEVSLTPSEFKEMVDWVRGE